MSAYSGAGWTKNVRNGSIFEHFCASSKACGPEATINSFLPARALYRCKAKVSSLGLAQEEETKENKNNKENTVSAFDRAKEEWERGDMVRWECVYNPQTLAPLLLDIVYLTGFERRSHHSHKRDDVLVRRV